MLWFAINSYAQPKTERVVLLPEPMNLPFTTSAARWGAETNSAPRVLPC
jgi:hypothetical protein